MNNMEQPSPELQDLMRHSMTQELADEIDAAFRRVAEYRSIIRYYNPGDPIFDDDRNEEAINAE